MAVLAVLTTVLLMASCHASRHALLTASELRQAAGSRSQLVADAGACGIDSSSSSSTCDAALGGRPPAGTGLENSASSSAAAAAGELAPAPPQAPPVEASRLAPAPAAAVLGGHDATAAEEPSCSTSPSSCSQPQQQHQQPQQDSDAPACTAGERTPSSAPAATASNRHQRACLNPALASSADKAMAAVLGAAAGRGARHRLAGREQQQQLRQRTRGAHHRRLSFYTGPQLTHGFILNFPLSINFGASSSDASSFAGQLTTSEVSSEAAVPVAFKLGLTEAVRALLPPPGMRSVMLEALQTGVPLRATLRMVPEMEPAAFSAALAQQQPPPAPAAVANPSDLLTAASHILTASNPSFMSLLDPGFLAAFDVSSVLVSEDGGNAQTRADCQAYVARSSGLYAASPSARGLWLGPDAAQTGRIIAYVVAPLVLLIALGCRLFFVLRARRAAAAASTAAVAATAGAAGGSVGPMAMLPAGPAAMATAGVVGPLPSSFCPCYQQQQPEVHRQATGTGGWAVPGYGQPAAGPFAAVAAPGAGAAASYPAAMSSYGAGSSYASPVLGLQQPAGCYNSNGIYGGDSDSSRYYAAAYPPQSAGGASSYDSSRNSFSVLGQPVVYKR